MVLRRQRPFLKGLSRSRGDSHRAISGWRLLGDSERRIALSGLENGANLIPAFDPDGVLPRHCRNVRCRSDKYLVAENVSKTVRSTGLPGQSASPDSVTETVGSRATPLVISGSDSVAKTVGSPTAPCE